MPCRSGQEAPRKFQDAQPCTVISACQPAGPGRPRSCRGRAMPCICPHAPASRSEHDCFTFCPLMQVAPGLTGPPAEERRCTATWQPHQHPDARPLPRPAPLRTPDRITPSTTRPRAPSRNAARTTHTFSASRTPSCEDRHVDRTAQELGVSRQCRPCAEYSGEAGITTWPAQPPKHLPPCPSRRFVKRLWTRLRPAATREDAVARAR